MRNFSIVLALLSLLVSTSLYAATYKWTDESGNVVYSQQPPKSGPYELIKGLKHSRGSNSASGTAEQSESDNPSEGGGSENLSAEDKKLKEQNCDAAKKNLAVYKVYTRVKGSDGKVTTLSDEDRQKRMEEAQNQIDLFCK